MSSNIVIRFNIQVAGAQVPFGQPFAPPFLELEEAPSQYDVQVAANASAMLWDGEPLPSDFDVLAITADQSCDLEFSVNEGESLFTLFLRAGGFPVVLEGSESYVGGLGGALENITSVQVKNRNTDTVANVSVLLGKKAA